MYDSGFAKRHSEPPATWKHTCGRTRARNLTNVATVHAVLPTTALIASTNGIMDKNYIYCVQHLSSNVEFLHFSLHTNERPYACNICGKTFSLSSSRNAHYYLHSSEKSHKCLMCKKEFRLKHQLTAHEKSLAHRLIAKEYSDVVE